ncbi:hypothetical protein [Fictibacillus terranigra]|uniref:Helix-turn-helix domain-containing protein n=1 Tax=Fictibacillus terranigra TaxID=3058424 RepID=A0ABT8E7K9_9BACL|nr:hypothetical protein [Fictibacillus sp. CENA-BCM004]MDN4073902.1 hypothetical protein [Fictibacillus sp. CENA-BCM004]
MHGQKQIFKRAQMGCGQRQTQRSVHERYGIKNNTQIKTWMKWYRENELHRFDQPMGNSIHMGMDRNPQVKKRKKNDNITT